MKTHSAPGSQRGLTLIEFMVSVTIGMLMVAALATLIADQSGNRAEADRSGRTIENGRYAIRAIADDVQLGGYWGELNALPTAPAALPDPCDVSLANLVASMPLHVQGYAPPGPPPTPVSSPAQAGGYNPAGNIAVAPTCLDNYRAGTDVLVVRHVDPDSTDVETAGVVSQAKVVADRTYLQTGLQTTGTQFTYAMNQGSNFAAAFTLLKKDKATLATLRKVVMRIYYVASCSVCTGASADTVPTLKMVELTAGPALSAPVSIAEGIENMQIDYGLDTDADGAPNGADSAGNVAVATDWANVASSWTNVMSMRISLLVRSLEPSPGYSDTKTYDMGAVGSTVAAKDGYRRHVFVQTVRLVNPSGRRAP
jgi:type IV pilus assembly protein PilW